uniref:Myb-like domain-containing protein n=1 Tax=Spongospora subterranea TaxID=70186 RepID=A0A0H5QQ33_9EUKA|eukprot:CRZ03732.1 hypothetical protein [Spongospora subterranea]
MREIRLDPSDRTVHLIDYDMKHELLNSLISILTEHVTRQITNQLPPSPSSLIDAMPGSGWYIIRSNDPKIEIHVGEYDIGTYARFRLEYRHPTFYIMYRVETERSRMISSAADVVMADRQIEGDVTTTNATPHLAVVAGSSSDAGSSDGALAPLPALDIWADQEVLNLRKGVERFGRRWKTIGLKYGFIGRTSKELSLKWEELSREDEPSGGTANALNMTTGGLPIASRRRLMPKFTSQETVMLKQAVNQHGQDWARIASSYDFGGRDGPALRKKWTRLQAMPPAHDPPIDSPRTTRQQLLETDVVCR